MVRWVWKWCGRKILGQSVRQRYPSPSSKHQLKLIWWRVVAQHCMLAFPWNFYPVVSLISHSDCNTITGVLEENSHTEQSAQSDRACAQVSAMSIHCLFVLVCRVIPHHWKGFVYEQRDKLSLKKSIMKVSFTIVKVSILMCAEFIWSDLLKWLLLLFLMKLVDRNRGLLDFSLLTTCLFLMSTQTNRTQTITLSTWIWIKHVKLYNLLVLMTVITLPSPFTWKLKLIEGNVMRDSILHDSSHQRVKQQ